MVESVELRESLDKARRHILGIVDGLSDEQWHRPVLPSGWAVVGLVNHLAIDVERFWFRAVMSGEQAAWDFFDSTQDSAWNVPPDADPASVVALYRREVDAANQIIDSMPPEASPASWPEGMFGSFRLDTMRAIILHVINETACHAGHLDAVREIIDGRQWMVL